MCFSALNPQAHLLCLPVRVLLHIVDIALVEQCSDKRDLSGIRGRHGRMVRRADQILLDRLQEQGI